MPSLVPVRQESHFLLWVSVSPNGKEKAQEELLRQLQSVMSTHSVLETGGPQGPCGGAGTSRRPTALTVSLGKTLALSEPVSSPHGGWMGFRATAGLDSGHSPTWASQERNSTNSQPGRVCPQTSQGRPPRLQQLPSFRRLPLPCQGARASLGARASCLGLSVSSVKWAEAAEQQERSQEGAQNRPRLWVPLTPPFRSFQGAG